MCSRFRLILSQFAGVMQQQSMSKHLVGVSAECCAVYWQPCIAEGRSGSHDSLGSVSVWRPDQLAINLEINEPRCDRL